jgi:hypothetical protein
VEGVKVDRADVKVDIEVDAFSTPVNEGISLPACLTAVKYCRHTGTGSSDCLAR